MNRLADLAPESATPARFTVEQFERMIEMGLFPDEHVELVHGEIIQLSPSHSSHGMMIPKIIRDWLALVPSEQLLVDAFLRLDDMSLRAFDITIIHPGVSPGPVLEPHQVLLGIEVAESSTGRDLGEKKHHYASAGIPHYLVVDLNQQQAILFGHPQGSEYEVLQERKFGDTLELPAGLGPIKLR